MEMDECVAFSSDISRLLYKMTAQEPGKHSFVRRENWLVILCK